MLEHHIQKTIVYRLAFAEGLRFSELKPESLENKLFDYHLKKVVSAGFVEKSDDGTYRLTAEGRRLGKRIMDKQLAAADKAEPVLFLAVRRATDKAWLLYRRKTHPLLDRVGFMHALPNAEQSVLEVAHETCLEKTGINANFSVLGSGFFTTCDNDALESYTNFTFLISDDAAGDLSQNDEFAEYFWEDNPDFTEPRMLPNMKTLGNLHKAGELFFIEKTFDL